MPRLPVISGKELLRVLSKAGFRIDSQRGSHVKVKKRLSDRVLVTTVPLHRELDVGTLNGILKQAEISREAFFKLLNA